MKIELRRPGAPWLSILLLITVVGLLLYAKMLNEADTKETRLFCQCFVIGGILIMGGGGGGGGRGSLPSWLGLGFEQPYWYNNQSMFVKWGDCVSQFFEVTNGVR